MSRRRFTYIFSNQDVDFDYEEPEYRSTRRCTCNVGFNWEYGPCDYCTDPVCTECNHEDCPDNCYCDCNENVDPDDIDPYDEIERLRAERNRLITDRDNYRTAALYLYRYITDHVAIIGDKEIKAWHVARDLYEKATNGESE